MMDDSSTVSVWQTLWDETHKLYSHPIMQILTTIFVVALAQAIVRSSTNRIVERLVRSHRYSSKIEERKREETLKKVFSTSTAIVLWLIGISVVLWQLHADIGKLLTGAGLLSVIAGLSAQSVIKDYLAGMFIILDNQMRVDDIVTLATSVGNISGSVEDISIRTTRLRDLDGNLHILNNGNIAVITNKSFQFSNVNLDINVTYDTDLTVVEKLINEAGNRNAKDPRFADVVIEPVHFLRVESLNEANVTVKAFGKVRPGSQWDVGGDFRQRLKTLFTKHHIAVPYGSTVVNAPKKK